MTWAKKMTLTRKKMRFEEFVHEDAIIRKGRYELRLNML